MKRHPWITLYLLGAVAGMAAAILVLAWQAASRWPSPHVGYQPRLALLLLIPTAYALVAPWLQKTRLSRMARSMWVALLLAVVVVDQFNLILKYEIWLHRGGPASGTPPWKTNYMEGRTFIQEWDWDDWAWPQ